MSDENARFHETFYEESFEGLEVMERNLLALEDGAPDEESVNEIFRAAHSIKGGAGAFSFTAISEFTHVLETVLDLVREAKLEVTQEVADLFLGSVDCVRELLNAQREQSEVDQEKIDAVLSGLTGLLGEGPPAMPSTAARSGEIPESVVEQVVSWTIRFSPYNELMHRGNDPVRLFRELAELGKLSVQADLSSFPTLDELVAEDCYLSWQLSLEGDPQRQQIDEIFDWVLDECDLEITREETERPRPTGFGEIAVELGFISEEQREEMIGVVEGDPLKRRFSIMAAVAGVMSMAQIEQVIQRKKARLEAFEGVAPATGSPAPDAAVRSAEPAADPGGKPSTPDPESRAETQSPAAPERRGGAERRSAKAPEQASIRVNTEKIDEIVNMVGELVITQSMLSEIENGFDMSRLERLRGGLAQLERNTRELQEAVMQIRMLPIGMIFNRYPRMVRDTSRELGKKIDLVISGEQTEVDKTVLEKIGDPLVHCLRNSLDHGLETPEIRLAAGKPETGRLQLTAGHEGGSIVIKIEDDGAGIRTDKILEKAKRLGLVPEGAQLSEAEIIRLIFHPGLSTVDQVTALSGRGVGMDVVRRNIEDLGGKIDVASEIGVGSCFTIRLPLTVAILEGQLLRVGAETYIIPLVSILETIQVERQRLMEIAGEAETYRLREDCIPVIHLAEMLGVSDPAGPTRGRLLVVVEADGKQAGLLVNELLAQQQVVIKSLETNYRRVQGISGATILGDGTVALILDVPGLMKIFLDGQTDPTRAAA